ncbi:MAG: DUF1854 domain-containing protein [Thermoproteota archaeon]
MPRLEDFLNRTWVIEAKNIKILKGMKPNTVRILGENGELFEVIPKEPFPISHPHFIIFTDMRGNELCMVEDYGKMDEASRKVLEEILEKLYFMPRIARVKKLETSGDEFVWHVETDKGPNEFRTRGRRSISRIGEKIVIIDINDNVYIVDDLSRVDEQSRTLLESVT